jgi:hypothetical protein
MWSLSRAPYLCTRMGNLRLAACLFECCRLARCPLWSIHALAPFVLFFVLDPAWRSQTAACDDVVSDDSLPLFYLAWCMLYISRLDWLSALVSWCCIIVRGKTGEWCYQRNSHSRVWSFVIVVYKLMSLVVFSRTAIFYTQTSILLPRTPLFQRSTCLPALAPTAAAPRAAPPSAVAPLVEWVWYHRLIMFTSLLTHNSTKRIFSTLNLSWYRWWMDLWYSLGTSLP